MFLLFFRSTLPLSEKCDKCFVPHPSSQKCNFLKKGCMYQNLIDIFLLKLIDRNPLYNTMYYSNKNKMLTQLKN